MSLPGKLFTPLRLVVVALLLSSCGFHPMYGTAATSTSHTPLQGNLKIAPMKGHEGQIFKTALEDRFNPEGITVAAPDYTLQVELHKTLIPEVVKSDGTIQRYNVRFDSDFKLFKTGVVKPIFDGSMRRAGSYDVATNANFATYEAEQDVIERTLTELSEDYVLRISGYFAEQPAVK